MKNLISDLMDHHKIMENVGALTHYGRITGIKLIPNTFNIETTIDGGLNVGGYLEEVLAKEFVGKYMYGNEIKSIEVIIDDSDMFKYTIKTDKVDYTPNIGLLITTDITTDDIIDYINNSYRTYDIVSKKKFLCYTGELVGGFSGDLEFSEFKVIHSVNTAEEAEVKYRELMSNLYSSIDVDDMFVRTINVSNISMNDVKKILREVADTTQRSIFTITLPNELKLMDKIIDKLQGR